VSNILKISDANDALQIVSKLLPISNLKPFGTHQIEFLSSYSIHLSRIAPKDGSAQSLAFWLRNSRLAKMAEDFGRGHDRRIVKSARGLVFQIPPSNVETVFVYSLAVSILTGNRNIVRIPSSVVENSLVFDSFIESLYSHPEISSRNFLVSYGYQEEVNEVFSSNCDLRVIWGGDKSINTLRKFPVKPSARDLTFFDRSSLALISTSSYLNLSDVERNELVWKFFNDSFWFDQLACSSPRAVIWFGVSSMNEASSDFYERLRRLVELREYVLEPAIQISKLNFLYELFLKDNEMKLTDWNFRATIIDSGAGIGHENDFPGGGVFFQSSIATLEEIVPMLNSRHQTLTHFGFRNSELRELAIFLNGRAVDRVVAIGSALSFDRYWDGYDLLGEFTKSVFVD